MEENVLESNLAKSEYEIQHFNFSAASVTYAGTRLMRDLLLTLLDKAICSLTEKETLFHELKSKTETIANNVFEDIRPELDLLKELDERYFSIPPHVLLPADFAHAKQNCTPEMNQELDKQLENLEKNFLDTTLMCACLEMENSDYDAIDELVKQEENVQSILLNTKPTLLEELEKTMSLYEKLNKRN